MENDQHTLIEKHGLVVKGMTCASCSARIERVLGAEEGVAKASVNLAAETIDLQWDAEKLSLVEIAGKVKGLGFELEIPSDEHRVELAISGMTCASCSARIEKVIGSMDGVDSMQVNLATETGRVVFRPEETGLRDLSLIHI